MPDTNGTTYANPDVLVSTDWVAEHLADDTIRLVEVDVDTRAYERGHIPGAIGFNWQTELQERPSRDLIAPEKLAVLFGEHGISNDHTVVLYGDNNNWFAAWTFWFLKYYGHEKVVLMNGGRRKWEDEGRVLTTAPTRHAPATYVPGAVDASIRVFRDEVRDKLGQVNLVDVRSPGEFSGELLAPENLPQEGAQRGGHIPGARNIPWGLAVAEDGTFRSRADLAELYRSRGVDPSRETIAYCRIGERSSHSWFVLKYLLGYQDVKNYDGSWTEWGNLVGAPVEKGP
jgi:thiosulfate/3-mercaptopyruvate sulfurtransferase